MYICSRFNNLLKITTMAKNSEKTTKNVANEVNEVKNAPATEEVKNQANEPMAKIEEPAKEEPAKVTAKVAIKAIANVAKYVKAERLGVNATVRLILEAANEGNEDAVNTLCALCDVPTHMAHAITVEDVRKSVNDFYPFVAVNESGRKINVKSKGVYYTTPATEEETEEQAKARVSKGYYSVEVTDYLTSLTAAAKARAKGIKQRSVNEARIYNDNKFSKITEVETVDVMAAKTAHTFNWSKVNVWRKHPAFGYYI